MAASYCAVRRKASPARRKRVSSDSVPSDFRSSSSTGPYCAGSANGAMRYALSNTGTLAYVPSPVVDRQLSFVSVSRQGAIEPLATYSGYTDYIDGLALSPDGRQLAFHVAKANDDVHILDLQRGIFSRVTFEGGDKLAPVWAPDGARIAYANFRGGGGALVWRPVDSRGEPDPIVAAGNRPTPSSFSPDGKTLAFTEVGPATDADIWVVSLEGSRQARPFLRTRFNEDSAVFSPDGQWLAYTSDESGAKQVYAVRFPDGNGRVQISTDGGSDPQWAGNGRELFYLNGGKMLSASISSQPVFTAGRPQVLFAGTFHARTSNPAYAVTRDGQHFLMVKQTDTESPRQIDIVLNWFEELKRRVPVGK